MAETDNSLKSYRGNCHCGAFIFELKVPEIKSVSECNCSICLKKGYLWMFPGDGMTVVKGEGSLKDYSFGPKNTIHQFCPTCGTAVMAYNHTYPADNNKALNVRTIQGLDIWSLDVKPAQGKDREPHYKAPEYDGPEPTADVEGGKLYTGSCHCGAVRVGVKVKPLDSTTEERVVECNCSICQRGGYIWIYPKKDQVVLRGEENMSYYVMGAGSWRKGFCKTCGVHIINDLNPLTDEQVAALPETSKVFREGKQDWRPVTLRMLNDFDLGEVKDKIQHLQGTNFGVKYVDP